jgi:phage tail sheath protein FI
MRLWQRGILAGSNPEESFFVQCGLGETMVPEDILKGRLIVVICVAPWRPAEFVTIRIAYSIKE